MRGEPPPCPIRPYDDGMHRRTLLSGAAVAALLAVTGCSGEEEPDAPTPQERLAAAQAKIEETDALTIALTSTGVPNDVNGVQSATGTGVIEDDVVKFEGEFQGRVSGVTATAGVLAIGDETYMKLFTPDYAPVNLDELGAPNPTSFFEPETGIASLIGATTDIEEKGQSREGRDILTEITGTLPGEKVEALLMLGGPDTEFDVAYGLTADDELRRAVLSGEFYEGTESTYTLIVTDYGSPIEIESPRS